jgi:O-antigen ligase
MSRRRKRDERRERNAADAASQQSASQTDLVAAGDPSLDRPDRLRPWLLAGAAALFVARPLVPSDGGPWLGEGEFFAALWLVLVLLWALGAVGRVRFVLRFSWIDAIVLAYFAWWSLSAWRGTEIAAPRPSYNALWDGVGMLAAFFTLRQASPIGREARALVAVMIALGIVLAAIAFHQYFVTLPQDRAALKAGPQGALREANWEQLVPGSGEFQLFKDRANSPEPLGTFSLTNSLAAYLAPWLIMAVGIAVLGNAATGTGRRMRLVAAACALPMAVALALTRSRSAWIAAIVGAGLLWFVASRKRPNQRRRTWLLAAVAGAGIAVVGGLAVVRPSLFEPAVRSFGFRLQYWQSTLAMIHDSPLWGCSPGNFGETYTAYKLPTALEEVKDPHNFALEIAASAGVPALLLFAAFLLMLIRRVVTPPGSGRNPGEFRYQGDGTRWILGGALAGIVLAMAVNRIFDFSPRAFEMLAGAILAGAVIAVLYRWINEGELPPALMVIGVAVLLVALLAVGGMTFGGVAGTLWLLAALALNATDRPNAVRSLPWGASLVFLAAIGALFLAQHQTGYEPVLACNGAMGAAINAQRDNKFDEQEKQLKLAADGDPYAFEPWRYLAPMRLEQWKQGGSAGKPNARHLDEYAAATRDHLLRVNPRSAPAWLQVGLGWLDAYRAAPTQIELARTAAGDCQRAAELYPNSAYIRAKLAVALDAAGDAKGAKAAAQEALRLDDLMPFAEAKLPSDVRKEAQRLASS